MISKLAVMDNNPEAPLFIPVETGVLYGAGTLMEDPFGSRMLQGMTAGSELRFGDIMLPEDARYVLRIDYSAGPTGMANVLMNSEEPVNAKLNGIGMWRKAKEGDELAWEALVFMQKGKDSLILRAETALPPIRSIRMTRFRETHAEV